MLFAALKLIAETIHELGMLFFSKDLEEKTVAQAPGGYVIFFVGAVISAIGFQSIQLLLVCHFYKSKKKLQKLVASFIDQIIWC